MGLLSLTLALALAPAAVQKPDAGGDVAAVCRDQQVNHSVAELVGTWSQSFAFARVIIGTDGRLGEVLAPTVLEQGPGYVVCRGQYQLVKRGDSSSAAYLTRIDHVTFRVQAAGDSFTVSLVDLPPHPDGSEAQTASLIARFTINGRPYADVLRDNQQRLARIAAAPSWIVGSWIATPHGGEDGRSACTDYISPAIFRINNTATIMTFDADGRYRSRFVHIVPTGDLRTTMYQARWTLTGGTLQLSSLSNDELFNQLENGSDTQSVAHLTPNVMRRGSTRFVRCVGSVHDIY